MGDWFGAGRISTEIVKAVRRAGAAALEPWQIRRVGKAKIDVEVDRTLRISEAKRNAIDIAGRLPPRVILSDKDKALLERAVASKFNEFMQEQLNKESILTRSLELGEQSQGKSRPLDDDWLLRFMKYAGEISNEHVQDIWAKILVNQATANRPEISLKSIDSLRFFDAHLCELFRLSCNCYAVFGFIFHEFIERFMEINDIDFRREMRILESFGVTNPYELSNQVDLLQRYEFLYYPSEGGIGVSRLKNIDSPVYLLSPIGVNLGSAIFNLAFYREGLERPKSFLKSISEIASLEDRAIPLWRFICNNLIAQYGDTIAIAVDGVTGYFSVVSHLPEDHRPTFEFQFRNRRQIAQLKSYAPELMYIAEVVADRPDWTG